MELDIRIHNRKKETQPAGLQKKEILRKFPRIAYSSEDYGHWLHP